MNGLTGTLEAIQGLDLGPIKFKLMYASDGPGWTREATDRAETLYRRFLVLVAENPDKPIVPSEEVDAFWHAHILDTMKYAEDSMSVFGHFLHHFPYFGLRGEADRAEMNRAFEDTVNLYQQRFGSSEPRYDQSSEGAVCSGCPCHKVPGFPGGLPKLSPKGTASLTRPTMP